MNVNDWDNRSRMLDKAQWLDTWLTVLGILISLGYIATTLTGIVTCYAIITALPAIPTAIAGSLALTITATLAVAAGAVRTRRDALRKTLTAYYTRQRDYTIGAPR